ncbi:MAG: hypothetical protein A2Z03_06550 [Chloroflexi bacterium RBG_16_56_8]|nr:MAG: hypothetical protein A2Z03_06550 [Chloroflexi bacterium RBG_16_56_8]
MLQLFAPGRIQFNVTVKSKTLSSLELLLLGQNQPETPKTAPLQKGELCPQCSRGLLDHNGLLQLECPECGYVNGEGGSWT